MPIDSTIDQIQDAPGIEKLDLFDFLLDNIPDRIYFKDAQSRFICVSRAQAEFFGIDDPALVIGKTDFDFFTIDHAKEAYDDEREIMRSGVPIVAKEEKGILNDGSVDWVITTKMPLKDGDGRIIGTCGISKNITERKRLEEQLLRSQRLESIGTLASGVAHDLNNILQPIVVSAPLLRQDLDAEFRETVISTIEKSALRGADIVSQVVTFARGADGKRTLIQPRHLVDEVVKIARETFPRRIRVIAEADDDIWMINADATQIHQVLLNLCVNARDAMAAMGGTLTVSAENIRLDEHYATMIPDAVAGPFVLITIGDTGSGIPPEVVNRIFDPFFTTKEVGKGTGLGLSIVSGIVKGHSGFINVYSEPGNGTAFKVYLPASVKASSGGKTAGAQEASLCGHGELVMLVDDEVEIRRITEGLLTRNGYQVVLAEDGTEAVAIYVQRMDEIKLVLTDIMMPHFDGVALTRALRKLNPDVKVIASSGDNHDARFTELRALSPSAILVKPYTKEKLLLALRQVLHG